MVGGGVGWRGAAPHLIVAFQSPVGIAELDHRLQDVPRLEASDPRVAQCLHRSSNSSSSSRRQCVHHAHFPGISSSSSRRQYRYVHRAVAAMHFYQAQAPSFIQGVTSSD